jgi:hypothetical protein
MRCTSGSLLCKHRLRQFVNRISIQSRRVFPPETCQRNVRYGDIMKSPKRRQLESLRASDLASCSMLLVLLAFASATVWAEVLEGRVVFYSDGDTITLLDERLLRRSSNDRSSRLGCTSAHGRGRTADSHLAHAALSTAFKQRPLGLPIQRQRSSSTSTPVCVFCR